MSFTTLAIAVSVAAICAVVGGCARKEAARPTARGVVAWSPDGEKVLCVDAERGKDTDKGPEVLPRRFVVLAAQSDNSVQEIWSHDARTGREVMAKELMSRGFDASVLDLSRHDNAPSMSAAAGETAILEDSNWYGTLARRTKFPNRPPVAYPSPDGRRAFVIPDERMIALAPIVHLDLPAGWRPVDGAGMPTYAMGSPDRGVLQVSLRRALMRPIVARGETLAEAVPKLAARYGWRAQGTVSIGKCAFGDWAGGAFISSEKGAEHVHLWLLGDGADLLLVTFISGADLTPDELERITPIALSSRPAIPG